jgi:uncharacterized protein (TIGR02391 family)
MTPKQLEKWRKDILSRLDVLKSKVRQARLYIKTQNLDELEDKADIIAAWTRIYERFPEDLQPSRGNDLARHLRFAMEHDFRDIETFDIPAVQRSIELYGRRDAAFLGHEADQLEVDFEAWELLHPQIRDNCMELFTAARYRDAARAAVDLIMDELRRLSSRTDDGDQLIRNAIGVGNRIGFSPNRTDPEKAITEGMKIMLQGIYKGVRHPCSHGYEGFQRLETFQILTTCSFVMSHMQLNGNAEEATEF